MSPRRHAPDQDLAEIIARMADTIAALGAEAERLRVQLAGCLVAADGWTGPCTPDGEGSYGWSPAFERVRQIRQELDLAREALRAVQWAGESGCPLCDGSPHHASDCLVGQALGGTKCGS